MNNLLKIFLIIVFTINNSPDLFSQISNSDLNKTIDFCLSQLNKSINEIPSDKFPIRTKGIGEWELTDPSIWTSGFFPGCLWYAYKLTSDSAYLNASIKFTSGLESQKSNTQTHDIGFMMFNSFGNGYKITKNADYKNIIIESANSLAARFNPKVGCIQSWNGEYQVIIDNMMNLELLFWASKNGGNKNLYDIAVTHANNTIKNHLRENNSSFHVVVYDTTTGKVLEKRTAQGFSDSSAWARGQAWGIYGFTMAYRETKDKSYLNTAINLADYFINHLPDDYIPYWDLTLPADHPKKFKDASAAAIALSAFLELRNYSEKPRYDQIIDKILKSLIKNYLAVSTESRGILLKSAYNVNSSNPFDWNASTIWGDYYFLESLLRYKKLE